MYILFCRSSRSQGMLKKMEKEPHAQLTPLSFFEFCSSLLRIAHHIYGQHPTGSLSKHEVGLAACFEYMIEEVLAPVMQMSDAQQAARKQQEVRQLLHC